MAYKRLVYRGVYFRRWLVASREEIRDVKGGIGDVLRQMNTKVMLESGRDYGYYIDKILRYLHSQGVVIKVERELPYKQAEIDVEILDLVNALNLGGVATVGSCSGHGKEHGYIILEDERSLIILPAPLDKDYITRELQFNQSIKLRGRLAI